MKKITLPVTIPHLLLLIFLTAIQHSFAQQPEKYNVLFVAVDDMNDWVGPFGGYEGIKTPNIDKLAKKGVVFKRA